MFQTFADSLEKVLIDMRYDHLISNMANKLLSLGRKEDLLLSCGTDYHANPEWEKLLMRIPAPRTFQNDVLRWVGELD